MFPCFIVVAFSYCILAFIRNNWVYKKGLEHNQYVYDCVTRWHKWCFDSKIRDENDSTYWKNRLNLIEKYYGDYGGKLYDLVDYDANQVFVYIWNWDKKKLINDVEKYKFLSWDNPVDKNEVAKGWI